MYRRMLGHDWTSDRFMFADMRDLLANLMIITANVHRKEGVQPFTAIPPIPRPGDEIRDPEADEKAAREAHRRLAQQLLPKAG